MAKAVVTTKAFLALFAIFVSAAACSCSSKSSDSTCDQAGGTCPAGAFAAKLHPGCCTPPQACPFTSTASSLCGDGCGHQWFEVGNTEFGPCNAGDTTCLGNFEREISNACNAGPGDGG